MTAELEHTAPRLNLRKIQYIKREERPIQLNITYKLTFFYRSKLPKKFGIMAVGRTDKIEIVQKTTKIGLFDILWLFAKKVFKNKNAYKQHCRPCYKFMLSKIATFHFYDQKLMHKTRVRYNSFLLNNRIGEAMKH